jgi:aryl-phospho-beta-D-glucosidase BglC (GH1 family)
MIRLIKNCIIIISVVAVLIGAVSALSNVDILFPKYEMTESVAFAQSIGKGWNLGNTFDACEKYSDKKAGLETETMWGNPETTKELIAYLKECGFDTLRLPVTWSQHMGNAPDYTVDKA